MKEFFCPHDDCPDYDEKNEYGCGAISGGSSAPFPIFCERCEDVENEDACDYAD